VSITSLVWVSIASAALAVNKCFEGLEEAGALILGDVELEDGAGAGPWTGDGDRAVAGGFSGGFDEVGLRPSLAGVEGIMDDLAIHLMAVKVAKGQDLGEGDGSDREFHRIKDLRHHSAMRHGRRQSIVSVILKESRVTIGCTDAHLPGS
jgi:hypothetical protein